MKYGISNPNPYPEPVEPSPEELAELMAELDLTEAEARVVRGLNLA